MIFRNVLIENRRKGRKSTGAWARHAPYLSSEGGLILREEDLSSEGLPWRDSHVSDFVVRVGVVPLSLSFKRKMRQVKRLAEMLVT